jgi:SAM-dependent methyltransferase
MTTGTGADDWDSHWAACDAHNSANPSTTYRQKLIFDLLALQDGPARLLDVGCGQGHFAATVRELYPGVKVVGLELSQVGVEKARRRVPEARFEQRDLTRAEPPPEELRGWATHAVCSELLEHVDQPAVLLRNVRAFLAPGARVVITVPGGPQSAFDKHIGHRRHYRTADLRDLLVEAGLEPLLVTGAGFPFFNLYRLAVIARGKRLVTDVSPEQGQMPWSARAVLGAFGFLFRWNRDTSALGWQRIAVAQEPERRT